MTRKQQVAYNKGCLSTCRGRNRVTDIPCQVKLGFAEIFPDGLGRKINHNFTRQMWKNLSFPLLFSAAYRFVFSIT